MNTVIKIDVTDWREAALKAERVPQTKDDLIEIAVDNEYTARQAAQFYLACRAAGLSPDDLLSDDKHIFGSGGGLETHLLIANLKKRIEINGKLIRARQYKAIQQKEDQPTDGDQLELEAETLLPVHGYTRLGTEASCENALRYLVRIVTGHIRNRLVEIAASKGDVRAAADALIAKINEIVEELINEKEPASA
jgi:hypothetical protein